MKIQDVLALNLKKLRSKRGITQEQLAEAIDISHAAIQSIESKRTWPTIKTIEQLSSYFKIDSSELFSEKNHETSSRILSALELFEKQTEKLKEVVGQELRRAQKRIKKPKKP